MQGPEHHNHVPRTRPTPRPSEGASSGAVAWPFLMLAGSATCTGNAQVERQPLLRLTRKTRSDVRRRPLLPRRKYGAPAAVSRATRSSRNSSDPTWRGRPLPRPTEDLEDQGLGFDVQTVLNRRSVLAVSASARSAWGWSRAADRRSREAASPLRQRTRRQPRRDPRRDRRPVPGDGPTGRTCSARAASCAATSGPASVDASRHRRRRTDDAWSSHSATSPTAVRVRRARRCTLALHARGRYSMYSEGSTTRTTCAACRSPTTTASSASQSIFPACYFGRWPHIDFEVYFDQESITDSADAIATSQVALPKAGLRQGLRDDRLRAVGDELSGMSLSSDNVFGDDGGAAPARHRNRQRRRRLHASSWPFASTTSTKPSGGDAPGGGSGPGGGGAGGAEARTRMVVAALTATTVVEQRAKRATDETRASD